MADWKKLGLIFKPGGKEWMVTHAQNPFPEKIDGSLYKIHFSSRDKFNQAHGGFVLIDFENPTKILETSADPTLGLGKLGCFDDSGVMPSCIIDVSTNEKYMYYTGWTQTKKVPFLFYIGLAASKDGGVSYERVSMAPVLGRNRNDPYMTAAPWVIVEDGIWKMWYVSCTGWEGEAYSKDVKHYYHIKYAESKDGITWDSQGLVCIEYSEDEYALARPFVLVEGGTYKMWYSYRGGLNTYRVGYAESQNGVDWSRKDEEVGIDVSATGWDSEMVCYPSFLRYQDSQFMFYNGNSYGKDGFGLALLE